MDSILVSVEASFDLIIHNELNACKIELDNNSQTINLGTHICIIKTQLKYICVYIYLYY